MVGGLAVRAADVGGGGLGWGLPVSVTGVLEVETVLGWALPMPLLVTGVTWAATGLGWALPMSVLVTVV